MGKVIDMMDYLESKLNIYPPEKPTFISIIPDKYVLDKAKLKKRHKLKEKYYAIKMHHINIGVVDYYNKTHRDIDGNK
jgi:hypothetical protein